MTSASHHNEGLKIARLLMVLSSISPLFILWAFRGSNLIPDFYFIGFCALMVILPNIFLLIRIHRATKNNDQRELVVGTAEDHRDHLLVYLFAMPLPFYSESLDTPRQLVATFIALVFITFLFWHLNLHYMNLLFAIRGYRIFTVNPPLDENPLSGRICYVVITPRANLLPSEKLIAYRLSDTVYLEVK